MLENLANSILAPRIPRPYGNWQEVSRSWQGPQVQQDYGGQEEDMEASQYRVILALSLGS